MIDNENLTTWKAEEAIDFIKLNHTTDPIQCLRVVEKAIKTPIESIYPTKIGFVACMRQLAKSMDKDEYEKLCIMVMDEIYTAIWKNKDVNIGQCIHKENRPSIIHS